MGKGLETDLAPRSLISLRELVIGDRLCLPALPAGMRPKTAVDRRSQHYPLWLWPNLLNLDAPVVALLWQHLFAREWQVPITLAERAVLGLTVWLIYAADRILDARRGDLSTARHRFHARYQKSLGLIWGAMILVTGPLALQYLHRGVLYWVALVGAAVLLYFLCVHTGCLRLRKERCVALVFSVGTALAPAWNAGIGPSSLAAVFLFSVLAAINCEGIERWRGQIEPITGPGTALLFCALLPCGTPALAVAAVISFLCFWFLDRRQHAFSPEAVRVLADVALLTPVLVIPFL